MYAHAHENCHISALPLCYFQITSLLLSNYHSESRKEVPRIYEKQGDPLPEFIPSYEGFVNGETSAVLTKQPIVSCEATASSAPGEYAVTVSGAEAQNYAISYVDGVLVVTVEDSIKDLLKTGQPFDIYTTTGKLVRRNATTLRGLPHGVYIIGGKKVVR